MASCNYSYIKKIDAIINSENNSKFENIINPTYLIL